jgi:hypothetical protein
MHGPNKAGATSYHPALKNKYFQFPEHLGFTIKTNKMGHFQINSFESLIIFALGKREVPCQVILQFKTLTIFLCSTECSM